MHDEAANRASANDNTSGRADSADFSEAPEKPSTQYGAEYEREEREAGRKRAVTGNNGPAPSKTGHAVMQRRCGRGRRHHPTLFFWAVGTHDPARRNLHHELQMHNNEKTGGAKRSEKI